MARGMRPDEVLGGEFGDRMSASTERAVVAMYHLQQMKAWTANIIEGLEGMLADAGLHTRSTIRRRCASWTSAATRA